MRCQVITEVCILYLDHFIMRKSYNFIISNIYYKDYFMAYYEKNKEYYQQYYLDNREEVIKKSIDYYNKNKPAIRRKQNEYYKEYYKLNAHKIVLQRQSIYKKPRTRHSKIIILDTADIQKSLTVIL